MFDLKKLQYIDAIYKYKNFTKASDALYVSQPAISTAVNALEKELGVKLIIRNPKKVVFTYEGEQFMQRVTKIISLCHETEYLMKDFSDTMDQHIRFGITQAASTYLVPLIISVFMSTNPRAKIHFDEGAMESHIEMLQNEFLDLVYNGLPDLSEANGLKTIPFGSGQIFAVLRRDHPFVELERIPLDALAKENLAMLSAKSKSLSIMTKAFEEQHLSPNIAFIYEHYHCMSNVVHTCGYVGIISIIKDLPIPYCEGLILKPIEGIEPYPMGFIMKKDKYLSKLGRDLITFVEQAHLKEKKKS